MNYVGKAHHILKQALGDNRMRLWSQKIKGYVVQLFDSGPGVVVTAIVAIGLFFLPYSVRDWLPVSSREAMWILGTLAAGSITLFGIFYAIRAFQIQYLAQRLPAELVGQITWSEGDRAIYYRLVVIVSTSLVALAFTADHGLGAPASNLIVFNLVLLVLTLLGLRGGISRIFHRSYSRTVVQHVMRRLSWDYLCSIGSQLGGMPASSASGIATLETDPFSLVEQVSVRAMQEGDLTTSNLLIRTVTGRIVEYLKGEGVHNRRAVLGWLGEMFRVVGQSGLRYDNRVTEIAITFAASVQIMTYELGLAWSERSEFLDALEQLWKAGVRMRAEPILNKFLQLHCQVFRVAIGKAPPERSLASLYTHEDEKPAYDTDAELEWDHLRRDFLYTLGRRIESLIAGGMSEAFRVAQSALRTMAWDVPVDEHLGRRQKEMLLRRILWSAEHSIGQALRRGCGEEFVAWEIDSSIDSVFEEEGLAELIVCRLEAMSKVVIEAAKCGRLPWGLLNEVAAAGRRYAREGRDELAEIVVETLGAIAPLLARHEDSEMRVRYLEAASALRSIARWDPRADSKIKGIVGEQLKRYSEEEDRLREWQQEIPGRKHLKREDGHAFPWA